MVLGYAQDEDELMDAALDAPGDMMPYSQISTRKPLDDVSTGKSPDVMSYIAQRQKVSPAPVPDAGYTNDPLMKQFESEQQQLSADRAAKVEADTAMNLGQAFSSFARGSNAPVANDQLFSNMNKQSGEILKSREEDLDRKQKIVAAIEARMGREAVSKNSQDYRKLMLSMANKNKEDRLNSLNIGKANSLFSDSGINRETSKLNAARSAQTLIDEIKAGHIKGSKNIRNQLTTIMSTIEMGGPGSVHDREAMGVNNLYTKAQDALAFLQSNPNDSIPPQYLDQLEQEANALGDRAAVNYKGLVDAKLASSDLSSGNPNVDPGQIHKLAAQRKNSFLQGNGYDPVTGEPLKKRSGPSLIPSAMADEGAPDWQKAALEELKKRKASKSGGM